MTPESRQAWNALRLVIDEYERATEKFGKFASTHEGYAVIKEEFDELWDEIKANRRGDSLTKEAVQVAAMGVRFLVDCCDIKEVSDD